MVHLTIGALMGSTLIALTAAAATISASPAVVSTATIVGTNNTTQPAQVSVQTWRIAHQGDAMQEIPLQEFYVAHLLSGALTATVDGVTTKYLPGEFWAVKAGSNMQVKSLGDLAVLETIVITKQ
jgi:hypothetical protein